LNRGRFSPLALATAATLISYALILADQFLGIVFMGEAAWLGRVLWTVYPLPVAFWTRIAILLKPGEDVNLRLDRAWWTLLLPVTMLLIFGGWVGDEPVNYATREPGPLYPTYALYNVIVTAAALVLLHRNFHETSPGDAAHRAFWWMRLAGFALCGGMFVLLIGIFSPALVFTATVLDIMIFGLGGIVYDAIAEGQAVRQDLSFVFIKILLVMSIILIPWGIAVIASDAWTITTAAAFFVTLTALTLGITLLEDMERLLDKLFFKSGKLETRDALRTLMLNAARQRENAPSVIDLDEDEFIRMTRRALSHMPNLPRLAASPLTSMQLVSQRVQDDANALKRANELRQILAECIEALRPHENDDYGISDEWRFFNALYYPYVAGISPYKRRFMHQDSDEEMREVMNWFQTVVPPRTLYNWQNHGAKMIAGILLEQEKQINQ
ncbi:MAG TPA: hypothetical protein VJZ27_14120, partial [Aggregatilineales bacterium]|nr:hypothetical protein [Aggregatilineales bacterium]